MTFISQKVYTKICFCVFCFPAVNTKVDVRFHVQSADWLSQEVRDKIVQMVQYILLNKIATDLFNFK